MTRLAMAARSRSALGKALPLLLALSHPAIAACHLDQVNSVPLTFANSRMLANIVVNGHRATMEIDTGAWQTAFTVDAAKRLELAITNTYDRHVVGIGGYRHWDFAEARRIDVGALHVPNALTTVLDGPPISTEPAIDGFLGIDLLGRFDLDIDISGRRLTMFQADADCTKPSAAMDPPLFSVELLPIKGRDHRPRFNVALDGQEFTGMLDTGAGRSVIFKQAADRLVLQTAPLSTGFIKGIGENKVATSRHILKSIAIGDLEIDNLPINIAADVSDERIDVLIGRDIMKHVHFYIAQSSGTLIMQAPPQPSHVRPAAAP